MNWRARKIPKVKNDDCLLEADEQVRLVVWLRKNDILHFHCPNGGKRGMMEAIRLKKEGVQPGVPDIIIPVARKGYFSLYIELKREKGGVVSETQKYWLDALNREGMKAVVCRGADEAIKVVEDYFNE